MDASKRQRRREAGVGVAVCPGRRPHLGIETSELQRAASVAATAAREVRVELLRLELMGASDAETRAEVWRQLKIEMTAPRAEVR